jgi:hypothetical protein
VGKQKPWDATFGRVQGVYWPQFNYSPRPTAVRLDAIEKELEIQFPASYRAFAEQFGLDGSIRDRVRILPLTCPTVAPGPISTDSVLNKTRYYRTFGWEEFDWAPESAPRDLRRVIVFATETGYHDWAFDPDEITSAKHGECRIYDVDRDDEAYALQVTAVAASFDEWLLQIDDRYNFERDEKSAEPEFPPVFKPRSAHPHPVTYQRRHLPRQKSAPTEMDLQLWLAWNNNTARDLALSIRDRGQTDAFPILADALQEAGCTNADLLNSCRTGDPDIDGAWVLQVLLGRAAR